MIANKLYVGKKERKIDEKGRLTIGSFVNKQIQDSKQNENLGNNADYGDLEFYLYRANIDDETSAIILSESPDLEVDLDYKLFLYKSVRQDKNSRISLADELSQEILRQQKDIVIIGCNDYFEIYSRNAWQQYSEKNKEKHKAVQLEFMSGF